MQGDPRTKATDAQPFPYFPGRGTTRQLAHMVCLSWCGLRGFRGWPTEMCRAVRGLPGDRTWRLRGGGQLLSPSAHWSSPLAVIGRDIYGLAALDSVGSFIDIGANIGSFSVAVGRRWPTARGAAYEPIPATFDYLVCNIAMNCSGRVVPTCRAVVAGTSGLVRMAFDPRSPQSSTAVPELMQHNLPTLDVETTTLGAVFRDFSSVDLLKMDVEGAEYDLICHASPGTLGRARHILLEYHSVPNRHPSEIKRKLETFGFRLERLDSREHLMLYRNTQASRG